MLRKGKAYFSNAWIRFKSGDRYAFEEIYTEFIDSLFSFGMKISNDRELVKDSIQDLFIDLYRYNIDLKKPESLEFYMFKSLKRIIYRKQKRKSKTESLDETGFSKLVWYNVEEPYFQNETEKISLAKLQKALNELNHKSRELIFYKFNSGLSYKEIGNLTGIKPDSVKKQIYRIIKGLRENAKFKFPVN